MPVLKPKYEKFAQELAKGKTQIEAFEHAGYSPHDSNATKLAAKPEIVNRVSEIIGKAAARAEVTIESLLRELDVASELALEIKQPATLVAIVKERGVLSGKRVERAVVAGAGDLDKLKSMSAEELQNYIESGASDATQLPAGKLN